MNDPLKHAAFGMWMAGLIFSKFEPKLDQIYTWILNKFIFDKIMFILIIINVMIIVNTSVNLKNKTKQKSSNKFTIHLN